MTLNDLLTVQEAHQRGVYHVKPSELRGPDLAEYLRLNVLAATAELHEVLDETQWKPWKDEQGSINRERYIEELADVVLFVANLCAAGKVAGWELAEAIEAAWAKNRERQECRCR